MQTRNDDTVTTDRETFSLYSCVHNRKYVKGAVLIYLYFAYWLGIVQDFYYGVVYLRQTINSQTASGSFPFMFGWTALMLWGVQKPVERRPVLLVTGLLVGFMLLENLLLFPAPSGRGATYMPVAGMILWFSAFLVAKRAAATGSPRTKGQEKKNKC